MKHLSKKQLLILCGGIVAVCIATVIGYVLTHLSQKREPTALEQAQAAVYDIDWQGLTGVTGSDRDAIVSLLTPAGEETIGSNVYETYTSDTISQYLPNFSRFGEIVTNADLLYIQYYTVQGDMIILTYDSRGLVEKSLYFEETDLLYYQNSETTEVWTNFRGGFQFGS